MHKPVVFWRGGEAPPPQHYQTRQTNQTRDTKVPVEAPPLRGPRPGNEDRVTPRASAPGAIKTPDPAKRGRPKAKKAGQEEDLKPECFD